MARLKAPFPAFSSGFSLMVAASFDMMMRTDGRVGALPPALDTTTVGAAVMPDDQSTSALDYALSLLHAGHLSVDADGYVWRHAILLHGRWKAVPARRAENVAGKGYLRLTLQSPGATQVRSVMAHRVIWTLLRGPIPAGLQVNHKDLDKRNNRLDNLELVTGSGNIRHSYANGRPAPWYKAVRWRDKARITAEQKAEIRRLRASGLLLREIAARFDLGTTHVSRICSEGAERRGDGTS
jgi:hypothetical protein